METRVRRSTAVTVSGSYRWLEVAAAYVARVNSPFDLTLWARYDIDKIQKEAIRQGDIVRLKTAVCGVLAATWKRGDSPEACSRYGSSPNPAR